MTVLRLFSILLTFAFISACHQPADEAQANRWQKLEDGSFITHLPNTTLSIDPNAGGRISCLAIDGFNLLTTKSVDSINYGATLWLSPQNLWQWPPPPILDQQPYRVRLAEDTLILTSDTDENFGIRFSKSFIPSLQDTSILLAYTMHNPTDSVHTYALWEVSRMHKDSQVIFRLEEASSLRSIKEAFWIENEGLVGVSVSDADSLTNKMYANGTGWLIYQKDSLALIKTFPNLSQHQLPPKHNEIEVYIDDTAYLEVEQHSPYVSLSPGASYHWQVRWYPRKLRRSTELQKWINKLENGIY